MPMLEAGRFDTDSLFMTEDEEDDTGLELPKSARTVRKTPDGYIVVEQLFSSINILLTTPILQIYFNVHTKPN